MELVKFRRVATTISLYLGLVILLFAVNPTKAPIIVLVLPFVLFGLALFMTTDMVVRRFLPSIPSATRRLGAVCVSGVPTFLLVLSSINQLTWRDVILVTVLVLCIVLYASRINFLKP